MGMNLEEMQALPERKEEEGSITVTHVAVVEDEETGIVSRRPLEFKLAKNGTLLQIHHYPPRRMDPDFHLGAVRD